MESITKNFYVSFDGIEWYNKDICEKYEQALTDANNKVPFTINKEDILTILESIHEFSHSATISDIIKHIKGDKVFSYADRYKFFDEQLKSFPPKLRNYVTSLLKCYEFIDNWPIGQERFGKK